MKSILIIIIVLPLNLQNLPHLSKPIHLQDCHLHPGKYLLLFYITCILMSDIRQDELFYFINLYYLQIF